MSWGGAYGQHLGNLAPFAKYNYAESALLTFMAIVKQNILNQCSKMIVLIFWTRQLTIKNAIRLGVW